MEKYTNALIEETSPYLLQHAHNPVDWVSWSTDAFEKAEREGKLVLVSVGYSACHWCHVMEHECFEDEEVATLMNKFFVCIKVDREERPDVDQVYMTAVQLMTQQGGWPLNCFTLPDGRPVYGGTYFPKEQWMHILKSLEHMRKEDQEKMLEYAQSMQDGIQKSELIDVPAPVEPFSRAKTEELVLRWSKVFDQREGGSNRAPKFPLPNNYEFLLRYAELHQDESVLKQVELSLDKMAMGGIYDQIGGGFSRYSVDVLWKVPHFEKMLYDNGQLLSLYALAYRKFKKPVYKRIIDQTVAWLEREMLSTEGAFYSALDADSEGVEGKFYVWTDKALKEVLVDDYSWVKDLYSINQRGFWEDDNYILLRTESDSVFASKMNWTLDELEDQIKRVNQVLLDERSHRIRPGLDDKCLTSWNAMTLKGLCDSYMALGDENFLQLARKNAKWLVKCQHREDGGLRRNYKAGKSNINGFLEDYAHVIQGYISLYQVTFEEDWIEKACELTEYVIEHFQDKTSKMFYFTSDSTELIARKMELNDNVLPASNSVMANNLFFLGKLLDNETYLDDSKQMLANVYDGMEMYGSGYSNWGQLLLYSTEPFFEAMVVGEDYQEKLIQLQKHFLPAVIFAGGKNPTLPMVQEKQPFDSTWYYICSGNTCSPPTEDLDDALDMIHS
jgi:uncharacterized protein YyaL (SSP411 family)